jgi:hypothetical protein
MPKKAKESNKENELEELKEDNLALLKSAIKQSKLNKQLKDGMDKLMEINKRLSERLKKKSKK